MNIQPFFDAATWTVTYVVWDPSSKDAVVIDPVLDYDTDAVATSTASLEKLAAFLDEQGLKVHYVLETHAHADHLSGSQWLRDRYGAKVGIGQAIRSVQEVFKGVFGLDPSFPVDGSQFDVLFEDHDVITAGTLSFEVLHTPGHTPACVSYHVGDAVFTGDALFMPDLGTGRCDFPKGSATDLYRSVHDTLYALPDDTRVFVGHDYGGEGRGIDWETTIGASKRTNKQLRAETTEAEYVAFRSARDRTLKVPRLLFPSVQVNIDAGRLPRPDANGRRYLRLPINLFS